MPTHVIVDGSNLATEGRAMPSLQQLNDAVMAFIAEHPDALITVVVDATFGHRISSSEVPEFDAAVSNNELVAPPAGAIGRGDAFLLSVANKVGATVLSNDSFQEFHGTYPWLFDEGRLIGGKPVPHIGWVFVARAPVRGPISRSAVKDARRKKEGGLVPLPGSDRGGRGRREKRQVSPEASRPMPIPKAPPPNATIPQSSPAASPPKPTTVPVKPAATAATAVNDFTSFLSFVEHHPVGTSVNATVETYSSHGAYVKLEGGVVGYVPLRLMSEPPPRSAREFMKIGDAVTLVVESFAPARRSIDLATTSMATAKPLAPAKVTRARKAAAPTAPDADGETTSGAVAATPATRRKKAAASLAPAAASVDTAAPADDQTAPDALAAEVDTNTAPKPEKATTATKAIKATRATKATKATRATKKAGSGAAAPVEQSEPAATDSNVTDADGAAPEQPSPSAAPAKRGRAKKAAPTPPAADRVEPDAEAPPAAPAKARRAKKAAPPPAAVTEPAEPASEGAGAGTGEGAGDAAGESRVEPAAENAASIDAAPARSTGRRRGSTRPRA
jgi:hypothetical protein